MLAPAMATWISPMLAVSDGNTAIMFYKAAFGATVRPIKRMLQGAVVDPFGHMWLIGKFLD
jgi:uncharacterized glyoxalase superfamily protein PhnB